MELFLFFSGGILKYLKINQIDSLFIARRYWQDVACILKECMPNVASIKKGVLDPKDLHCWLVKVNIHDGKA